MDNNECLLMYQLAIKRCLLISEAAPAPATHWVPRFGSRGGVGEGSG